MHYWYVSVECFLSQYLTQAHRAAPMNASAANLWLVRAEKGRELKGSPEAPPKPAVCALLQARAALRFLLHE